MDSKDERIGFYSDLIEPFFLNQEDKDDAVVLKSLKTNGWHLLNAINVNLESRANMEEELKFRTTE